MQTPCAQLFFFKRETTLLLVCVCAFSKRRPWLAIGDRQLLFFLVCCVWFDRDNCGGVMIAGGAPNTLQGCCVDTLKKSIHLANGI